MKDLQVAFIGLFTFDALVADPSTRSAIREEHILHANYNKEKAEHLYPSGVMNGRMIKLDGIYFCEIHLHKKAPKFSSELVPERTKVATR